MNSDKYILVTGGAGFVGSHLVDRFINEGHKVVAMDNLITGNVDNLKHHFGNTNFEFIHHDVSNHIHLDGKLDFDKLPSCVAFLNTSSIVIYL